LEPPPSAVVSSLVAPGCAARPLTKERCFPKRGGPRRHD
jgi:hypothetical protein